MSGFQSWTSCLGIDLDRIDVHSSVIMVYLDVNRISDKSNPNANTPLTFGHILHLTRQDGS